ncbi:formylglycine-generating enzyme required for sulfatase activity [Mesorhizobium soli]|uniref:SUMF1/EgtB/PvdO family nonheme iron enzyme n=1 Tax=Pseudaminobacter soli (ex Li et al. 2025) TaxID=1295366 RepID=UPI0024765243|nr:SUMF1/EgtB/PvdO family nonheme iron enzyme [Mesorhizobium soli]MDH6233807.1 formylglycine-generating enzyme required for sulfatase activity [Mesorhizobium soli]
MKLGSLLLTTAAVTPLLALTVYLPFQKPDRPVTPTMTSPATVVVSPGRLAYRLPGEFLSAERPVDAPENQIRFRRSFDIMAYQVSAADYALCVSDGACEAPDSAVDRIGNLPATGVSFRDASAYAQWLSGRTGQSWRLPTDEEWAFAAAERFSEEVLDKDGGSDAIARWLARYRSESEAARGRDPEPKPQGHFGANSNGLYDVGGNVWEWTTTCYRRVALDRSGRIDTSTDNCGVRVVSGKHRGYMSFFIRDGKSGGCAAGLPPDNLGIRLVRERPSMLSAFKALWRGTAG